MSYNKVILIGNLTRDPEVRFTPGGSAIAKISMALNRRWKDGQGQPKEEVTFVDVDAFGKTAENVGQYCKKGSAILVEGRLKMDNWEDKQTQQKRSRLGVVAEVVNFMSGGKREEGREAAPARRSSPTQNTQPSPDSSSDIPF